MKLVLILFFALTVFSCSNPDDQPIKKVVVEFHAAQLEPDSNLVKMTSEGFPEIIYVHSNAAITNIDIDTASVVMWDKKPQVKLFFSETGKEKLANFTKKNIARQQVLQLVRQYSSS